jgi:hypothetical protein
LRYSKLLNLIKAQLLNSVLIKKSRSVVFQIKQWFTAFGISLPSLCAGWLCAGKMKVGVAVMCCGCIWWRLAAVAGTLCFISLIAMILF